MSSELPIATVHGLWIISRDASFMIRRVPAIKMTEAMEHAKPSQTVVTFMPLFLIVL